MKDKRQKIEDLLFATAAIIGVTVITFYAVAGVLNLIIYFTK